MFRTALSLLLLGAVWQISDAACTFPSDLVGSWISSTMGTVTFTTTQVTIKSVYNYGDLTFDCDTLDGTQYMIRSNTTVTILGNQLDVLMCLDDLTSLTASVKYKLQLATTKLSDASDWRIKVLPTGTTLTASNICDVTTPYVMGTQEILIKDGSVSSAYIQCPDSLLGTFSYTYDAGSGNLCPNGSYLDVCSDITQMTFHLSMCSQMVAFSSGGVVNCVYSQYNNATSTSYVTVYNADSTTNENTTYRYACLAVTSSGGMVYVSESAQICQSNQTSTYVATGATLQLTPNLPSYTSTEPITDTMTTATAATLTASAGSTGMAIGISFALLVIILLVVLCLFIFCGRDRLSFYKQHCGGRCYVCCSKTSSCLRTSLAHCCSCLVWTKRMLLRCYDCCCPECSQSRVEPTSPEDESTVVVEMNPTDNKTKSDKDLLPLPPSVEEVDNVDSKGNPRRLPPIETPRIYATIIEEDDEDIPQSPSTMPPIANSPPPRATSPAVPQPGNSDPHVPDTAEVKESPKETPQESPKETAEVKMEPEEKVSEVPLEETPYLSTETPAPPEQSQGEAEPVAHDAPEELTTPRVQETTGDQEAVKETPPVEEEQEPAVSQDDPVAEDTSVPQEAPLAQDTTPSETDDVKEMEPAPLQHSTPRDVEAKET